MESKNIIQEKVSGVERSSEFRHERVTSIITERGQFLITISSKDAWVEINHGWNDQRWSYENPGLISIVLTNQANKTSYAIYMTEADIEDFPKLLDEAFNIANLFLAGDYELKREKNLFRKQDLVYFKNASGVYRYANKMKEYVNFPIT